MHIQIIRPLSTENDTFQGNKIGDINDIISFEYTKRLYQFGEFSISMPRVMIEPDTLLYVDKKHWLIVEKVQHTESQTTITGTDLKAYLGYRYSLFDVTDDDTVQGYDVQTGSTEAVLKHYVDYNIINPSDTNRKIIGLVNAANLNRGLQNDTYMSRFDRLDNLAETICKNAKIGWDVVADVENNCFIFDVVPITDKTINQDTNNRVIFEIERGNIDSFERVLSKNRFRNAFYATKSGSTYEAEAVTILCKRDEESQMPSGYKRRELQISVSCESVADIELYAKKEMDKNLLTDTLSVSLSRKDEYGNIYSLGDKVTVKLDNETVDLVITEVRFINNIISLTLGNTEDKPLTAIIKKIKGV